MDAVNNISIMFMLHRYVAEYVTRVEEMEALRAELGLKIIMRRTTGCTYARPSVRVLLIYIYNK